MPVPDDIASDLPDGNVEIAYAATDGVVVIGSSPDFVKHVLDAGAGQSLADDARYQRARRPRRRRPHRRQLRRHRRRPRPRREPLAEATAAERAEYEESIKPFLTPFDAFVAATVIGGDLDEQHAVITVK